MLWENNNIQILKVLITLSVLTDSLIRSNFGKFYCVFLKKKDLPSASGSGFFSRVSTFFKTFLSKFSTSFTDVEWANSTCITEKKKENIDIKKKFYCDFNKLSIIIRNFVIYGILLYCLVWRHNNFKTLLHCLVLKWSTEEELSRLY